MGTHEARELLSLNVDLFFCTLNHLLDSHQCFFATQDHRIVGLLSCFLLCTYCYQFPRHVLYHAFLAHIRTPPNEQFAPFLLITRKAVAIHPEANVWVDAVELSTTLVSHKPPLSTRAVHDLERALTLYKGDFLAGFYISESQGFEDWLRSERERLRVGVMQTLSHLIDFHVERASFDAGIAHAARLLELDPLREDAHRQMMLLLASSSQRSAALAQYDICRRVLADELGVEPEVTTTTLYRQIQSGAFVPPTAPLQTSINVPAQPTRFIGREAELAQLEEYLDTPDCRLLTLIGPGGVGKTRLAYEVAKRKVGDFPAGVYAVPLSGVASPQYLASTIAERLTLPLYGSADQKAQLLDSLREKHLLLVMDNCEHVLEGMELLAEILAVAPGVHILATSRERLNLQGEWLFPVQGLPFPQGESEAGAQTYPAMQLFEQSARRGGPGFHLDDLTDVARICKLVEGLPLAIELAASWVHHMPCERIASHIQGDLDFLSTNLRDVPERHRSTRALFEHSWRLLSEAERLTLRKLSVFRGGFDADAATHIAGASLRILSALVEKSLVRASPTGRYDLHELLRQFAEEKLNEAGESAATLEKHLDYFVVWAEEANLRLRGVQQVTWYQRIETEHDNLRAALAWGINGQRAETGLRLANALWWFWFRRGYVREGFAWLKVGIERTEGDTSTRAHVTHCLADLALHQGNYEQAAKLVSDSLSMSQSFLGNFSNREFSVVRLLIVGKLARACQDYEEAARLFGAAEALQEQHGYLLEPLPHTEYEEVVAQVRMQLEAAVFDAAWAEGQGMTEEVAITFALGYLQTQFDVME